MRIVVVAKLSRIAPQQQITSRDAIVKIKKLRGFVPVLVVKQAMHEHDCDWFLFLTTCSL
jgi:hypothetical protein